MESGAVFAGLHPNPTLLLGPARSAIQLLPPLTDKKSLSPHLLPLPTAAAFSQSRIVPLSNNNANSLRVASPASDVALESADIDWDNLGFGLVPTDYMYMMKCSQGEAFSNGELQRFGNLELSPSAGILNYGQGLFEGLKAYRKHDGNILLFRPEENAMRLKEGAVRMCMPAPTVDQFLEAVKATVLANERWVIFLHQERISPLQIFISGTILYFTFIPCSMIQEGLAPINLIVETEMHRATPGGTGGVKTIGNYAAVSDSYVDVNYCVMQVLQAQSAAKAKGFSDVLYLDSTHKKYLEEVSSCNVFVVKGNVISTPAIKGTILPGITRKSLLDVAISQGFQVEEHHVTVDDLLEADEVFCTGTAVVVSPVGSITYLNKRVTYGGVGRVSQQLYSALTSLQMGLAEDTMGWIVELK
ncbi:hypothetical protein SASPL_144872 [Salvia splendens]|uniref:Branched-chain-amino-acid aminotransferase n=1 Tax=Salvia splendens TaxID=180675 RepID=A0A8X8Z7J4_SALSN|nr:hypothetical protein SASPL_144872 [Salvia splendens]